MFRKVVIFGVGLIGGSFALALKHARRVNEVVGVDRSSEALERALQLGLIDRRAGSLADAVVDADLILLAVPVAQTAAILHGILPYLHEQAIISDVGSTKADVVAAAREALGARIAQFVPGHPIAGREVHGPDAALADLYVGKNVILTPLAENAVAAIDCMREAWQGCGARVTTMPVEQHDRVLAAVSHLPHVLAYALVAQIVDSPDADLKLALAGAGFRDFTRIAASSPEMWRDIVLANRSALLAELERYSEIVNGLKASIERGDGAAIEAIFTRASRTRSAWPPPGWS